jgi:hypothetical protein
VSVMADISIKEKMLDYILDVTERGEIYSAKQIHERVIIKYRPRHMPSTTAIPFFIKRTGEFRREFEMWRRV